MQPFIKEPLAINKAESPKIQFYISELNSLLNIPEHLSNFDTLLKAINEVSFQNKSD